LFPRISNDLWKFSKSSASISFWETKKITNLWLF